MTDDLKKPSDLWPLPKFHFIVESEFLGSACFQEVSGLDLEAKPVEYRHGEFPLFSNLPMPDFSKNHSVTFKHGVIPGDADILKLFMEDGQKQIIEYIDLTIKLIDETGQVQISWELSDTYPIRYSGPPLSDEISEDEIHVEALEFSFTSIRIIER